MKKIANLLFAMLLMYVVSAQPAIDHLQKSKNQKTAAFITLGVGAATFIPGIIILSSQEVGWNRTNWNNVLSGTGLTIVGVGCLTASTILFIASNRNKRKADPVISFINKPVEINTGVFVKRLPYSIGMSIALR